MRPYESFYFGWQKTINKQSNIQFVDYLLKAIEETCGFEAIHLGMMKLERDGQSRFEQPLMVFAPCQEGIGEQLGIDTPIPTSSNSIFSFSQSFFTFKLGSLS